MTSESTQRPHPIPALTCRVLHDGDQIVLKVQESAEALHVFSITRDQLFGVNADSADILARGRRG